MPHLTYITLASRDGKVLVWLRGEIMTPPFSTETRREAGFLLRQLQQGVIWRIIYRVEPDAIVILDVYSKKSQATPNAVIQQSRARLAQYLQVVK
jgi:phage-related protein